MKKKMLSIIGSLVIIALMVFNTQFTNNANDGSFTLSSLMQQAFATDGEGGGDYTPESCTSTTYCLMHYTTLTNSKGQVFCCSKNVTNEQGKAKA
ncbi:MAG: hypothetical protein AB2L20_30725 [Mangrovibacterium sp.]